MAKIITDFLVYIIQGVSPFTKNDIEREKKCQATLFILSTSGKTLWETNTTGSSIDGLLRKTWANKNIKF